MPTKKKAPKAKKASPSSAPKRTRVVKARKPSAPIGPRHVVFVDVENTSSEHALIAVLDALGIDRTTRRTELIAVGNWRAVGPNLGRRLGSIGAQLMHSAPARGVRDWSDLWIAVAAGCWLGQSQPGDILEIISNDRAFDAVGDAAAARGVIFRRLQHRRDVATPAAETKKPEERKRPRGKRGGRRRRHSRQEPRPPAEQTAAPRVTPPPEPHGASRDQMLGVIGRLTDGQAGRWVNLDVLERALKEGGFSRPPGSQRLVTRLRAIKDLEIDSHGRVRLATPGPA